MADGNIHEVVSHLGRTHLSVEPFIVTVFRNFPTVHAVANLLWPHFEGTVFINYAATQTLVAPGGQVDRLLQGQLTCTLRLTVNGVQSFGFDANLLPAQLIARGVDTLPSYSYRDDAMLYWNVIHSWVMSYLAATGYDGGAKVAGDAPIQAWYRESVGQTGDACRVWDLSERRNAWPTS